MGGNWINKTRQNNFELIKRFLKDQNVLPAKKKAAKGEKRAEEYFY